MPVPLLSAIFHYTRRQRKVENCRNSLSSAGVFANLESAARPAELDIGCATNANLCRPVYFCCGVFIWRAISLHPSETHAKHTQLSATLLRGRHKLIMSVDVPSRLYFAVECVNKDLLKALRKPNSSSRLSLEYQKTKEKTKARKRGIHFEAAKTFIRGCRASPIIFVNRI